MRWSRPSVRRARLSFAAKGGAGHAEAFAGVVGFGGEAERLPSAECEEALGDAAEEEIAAGELGAVVTDTGVEGFDGFAASWEVVGVGGFAWGGGGDHCGAGLELGFGLLVLEVLELRAPCGLLGFHFGGDVGFRWIR